MSVILQETDSMQEQYLTFVSCEDEFGIGIHNVKDIISLSSQAQGITPVPGTSGYIRGIINLRGTIVPIIDVRMRFSRPEGDYDDRTCIIVVDVDEMLIGMLVDAVHEVRTIPNDDLAKPPQMGPAGENHYVSAIATVGNPADGGTVILVLDIHKLFYDGELLPDLAEAG